LRRDRGASTTLRDIEVSVMTGTPHQQDGSSLMCSGRSREQGCETAQSRVDLRDGKDFPGCPLAVSPSSTHYDQSRLRPASSNFFPGTKVLASELMEHSGARTSSPCRNVTRAYDRRDDQYIRTGGQFLTN
jgi:hypothetical protein